MYLQFDIKTPVFLHTIVGVSGGPGDGDGDWVLLGRGEAHLQGAAQRHAAPGHGVLGHHRGEPGHDGRFYIIVYLQVVRLPGAGEGDVRDAEEADVDHLLLGAAAGGEVTLEQAGVELQLAA